MPLAGTRKNCAFLLLVQGMKTEFLVVLNIEADKDLLY